MMTLDKENSNESNERLLQLVGIENPGVNDVPMGRGGFVNSHPGHRQYMRMVRGRKLDYVSCEKSEKIKIAWSIVRDLRSLDPPARFLRKDRATGLWYDVGDKKFREKVSQALREHQPLLKAVIDLEDLGSDIWESNGRDTQLEPILEQRQSLTPPATLRLPCDSEQRRMAFASSRVELSSMLHVTDMSGCDGFRDEGSLNLSDFTVSGGPFFADSNLPPDDTVNAGEGWDKSMGSRLPNPFQRDSAVQHSRRHPNEFESSFALPRLGSTKNGSPLHCNETHHQQTKLGFVDGSGQNMRNRSVVRWRTHPVCRAPKLLKQGCFWALWAATFYSSPATSLR